MYRFNQQELDELLKKNIKSLNDLNKKSTSLTDDAVKIKFFFENIFQLHTVFGEFEDRFNHFVNQYKLDFEKYPLFEDYLTETKEIPFFIPFISKDELESVQVLEGFRPIKDQKNILLLFLFSQLIDLTILSGTKSLDQQLIYLSELIDRDFLNHYILTNRVLYIDAGYLHNVTHGKYIHLIQYILLGIALKQGVISLPILVGSTATSGWFHTQLLKNLFSHTNKHGVSLYDVCFENFAANKIAGAPGINFFLLTRYFGEYCPNFSALFRYSYVKSRAKIWRKRKKLNSDFVSYQKSLLSYIGKFDAMESPFFQKWHTHYVEELEHCKERGMLNKKNRSADFIRLEALIRMNYQYKSSAIFRYEHQVKADNCNIM